MRALRPQQDAQVLYLQVAITHDLLLHLQQGAQQRGLPIVVHVLQLQQDALLQDLPVAVHVLQPQLDPLEVVAPEAVVAVAQ